MTNSGNICEIRRKKKDGNEIDQKLTEIEKKTQRFKWANAEKKLSKKWVKTEVNWGKTEQKLSKN